MHLVANRVMLEHLKKHGLLQGDVDDMMKVNNKEFIRSEKEVQ